MDSLPICVLEDCTVEWATEEGILTFPGEVYTVEELVHHLHVAATREPHILNMNLLGELRARIAIGGPWAAISFHHLFFGEKLPFDHPPSWYAIPDQPPTTDSIAFVRMDIADDIPADRLL